MIYPYDNETQTRWDRGELQVQILVPGNAKPIGFCDGSDADLAEIQARAEEEGAGEVRVEQKSLKTGRQIWTVQVERTNEDADVDDAFDD
ncbi:MAG: hypothetical protein EVA89_14395 [Sandaracinaceae bacterium]|nr:MAG: hypothetical protein EVA89_14395 [Sandaracinaceae bacterium]